MRDNQYASRQNSQNRGPYCICDVDGPHYGAGAFLCQFQTTEELRLFGIYPITEKNISSMRKMVGILGEPLSDQVAKDIRKIDSDARKARSASRAQFNELLNQQ